MKTMETTCSVGKQGFLRRCAKSWDPWNNFVAPWK
jgi:hypothetical protein